VRIPLVVDSNEPEDIPERLRELGVEIEVRKIAPGDYVLGPVGIERKTLYDFFNSMVRKRLFEQVQRLREVGWSDAQIAEAVYDGALFNLFVRLADAFDIHPDPSYDAAGAPGVLGRPDGP